jgi:hypothetical protein
MGTHTLYGIETTTVSITAGAVVTRKMRISDFDIDMMIAADVIDDRLHACSSSPGAKAAAVFIIT